MAFSHSQLDALEAALASGTLELKIGDKAIKYQSTADLIRARDMVRDQLECVSCGRSSVSSFSRD
jgi:hypothetical protein